jgi:glycosyltransferase involved in cell wall biosynthesis
MISIVIPAYNEEKVIFSTIQEIVQFLTTQAKSLGSDFEIIVVDDGSQDTTAKKIDEASLLHPMVKKISLDKNGGKGNAVRIGMLESLGDCCLFMDADHSVSIENLERFYKSAESDDVTVGTIYHNDARYSVTDSNERLRKFFRKIYRYIPRYLFGFPVSDTQRGFKLFSRKAINAIFPYIQEKGYVFDIEILVLAQKNNLRVTELPVAWNNPYNPKINLRQYVKMAFGITRIYTRHYILNRHT